MNEPFPFGFPLPTAIYLTLYVVTLSLHVVFMNYVLAGTGYIAAATLLTRSSRGPWLQSPSVLTLRDWMPFALGAAITAGVAPLLFVQVLYQKSFYTANLLLFHRWMAILPVLILGFYLLYVIKTRRFGGWRAGAQRATAVAALACFLFTGYSWTQNHLLSLDQQAWTSQYARQSLWYHSDLTLPRFCTWFFGAFSTMLAVLQWQVRPPSRDASSEQDDRSRPDNPAVPGGSGGGMVAIGALALSVCSAIWYYSASDPLHRAAMTQPLGRYYLIAAGAGVLVQVAGWLGLSRAGVRAPWRWLVSAGVVMTIVGTSVVRESVRIASMDMEALAQLHTRAAAAGGMLAFVFFFVLNALLIFFSIRWVRTERLHGAA